jgi:hypothetical protein
MITQTSFADDALPVRDTFPGRVNHYWQLHARARRRFQIAV